MESERQRILGQRITAVSVAGLALFLIGSTVFAPPISTASDADGATLVSVQGAPSPGRVLSLDSGALEWSDENVTSYHGVTAFDDGDVLATIITTGHEECGRYESPCAHTGVRILHPETGEVSFEWTYPVRTDLNSEVHDAEVLPSDRILVVGMEYERVFVRARNGTINWQWNASSFYDPPSDPTRTDWLHMNDIDRIGDGRFLVSVRNENQLLILERGNGVTDVINEYGNPTTLRAQHNPQYLSERAILVADSGNDRIVELEKIGDRWVENWTLSAAGGMSFDWPCDADRLVNGNTLVTDSRNDRVVEVTEDGDVVWSERVRGLPYEADRLLAGETVDGEPYGGGSSGGASNSDIPFVESLYVVLTHVAPIPYWVSARHVLASMRAFGRCDRCRAVADIVKPRYTHLSGPLVPDVDDRRRTGRWIGT